MIKVYWVTDFFLADVMVQIFCFAISQSSIVTALSKTYVERLFNLL
ncbi:MAG: hypothetical protein LBC61_03690 [Candidatus Peribacteria bacterium]|nr:hypothetical protein [Candidatus Peribacteria bacterium]